MLYRYTSLPILLDILHQKRITLLSPGTWEDRNDAHYLERYKEESKLRTLLAICFSAGRERFHHWRVFSSGSSGVRIEFEKEQLLSVLENRAGFRHQAVEYRLIQNVKARRPELKSWPFLKREAFKDECEYRIIFESSREILQSVCVPLDLSSIRLITLSPWLPASVAPAVTETVHRIDGCAKIKVSSSTLIENSRWKAAISK
jgi:hypothetical protein